MLTSASAKTLDLVLRDDPAPAARRGGFGAWWMVGVLLFLYVVSFMDRLILTMLVEPIKASLKLSDVQMGLLIGPAFAFSYAIFGLPFGWASDRYSRKWVIWAGVSLWSIATGICSLAGSFSHLLLARVGVGVGEASISPAAYSLMADKFPPERLTTAISFYSMAPKIGIAVSFALGGVIISLASSLPVAGIPIVEHMQPWQLTFLVIGVPSLALALLSLTIAEPPRRRRRTGSKGLASMGLAGKCRPSMDVAGMGLAGEEVGLWAYLGANRAMIGLMLAGFACVGAIGPGVNQWVPTYMSRAYGWTPLQYGSALGLASTIAACFLPFGGLLIDWLYKRGLRDAHIRFYTWLLVPLVPLSALAFHLSDPRIFLVCYAVIQAIALPFMLYLAATIQLVVPRHLRCQVTGFFLFVISVVPGALGPVAVAGLTDYVFADPAKLGWSLAIVAPTGCAMALVFLRLALRPVRTEIVRLNALRAGEIEGCGIDA